jgi:hypothetical protein
VVDFVTPVGFKVSLSVILGLLFTLPVPAPLRAAPDLGLGLGQGVSMLLEVEVLVLDGVDGWDSVDSSSARDPLLGEEPRFVLVRVDLAASGLLLASTGRLSGDRLWVSS